MLDSISVHVHAIDAHTTSVGVRTRVKRLLCKLQGGHDMLPYFDHDRVCLKCAGCGAETPGWTIDRRVAKLR